MVKINFTKLMGQYQVETGEILTFSSIADETGIARSTLSRIGHRDNKRVDFEVMDRLLAYFSRKLNRTLTTNDILQWRPDDASELQAN